MDRLDVRRTGEEALQDGPNAADLAGRLMGDVNDDIFVGHRSLSKSYVKVVPNRTIYVKRRKRWRGAKLQGTPIAGILMGAGKSNGETRAIR